MLPSRRFAITRLWSMIYFALFLAGTGPNASLRVDDAQWRYVFIIAAVVMLFRTIWVEDSTLRNISFYFVLSVMVSRGIYVVGTLGALPAANWFMFALIYVLLHYLTTWLIEGDLEVRERD